MLTNKPLEAFREWTKRTTVFDLVTSKPLYRTVTASPKYVNGPELSQKALPSQIIDISDGMLIADVIVQLAVRDVLYLPVYRLEESLTSGGVHRHVPSYLYWIGSVEIIKLLVKLVGNYGEDYQRAAMEILHLKISEVHDNYLNDHTWIPFQLLDQHVSLFELLKIWQEKGFSSPTLPPFCTETGSHGLQVINPTDFIRYVNLVAGSSAFADLFEHPPGRLLGKSLEGDREFVRAEATMPALRVFERMLAHSSTIAAILSASPAVQLEMFLHLSAQDVLPIAESTAKLFDLGHLWIHSLHSPVLAFCLSRSRKSSTVMAQGLEVFSIATTREHNEVTLAHIIRKMLMRSVHQIWLLEPNQKVPQELFSMRHVIRFLAELL